MTQQEIMDEKAKNVPKHTYGIKEETVFTVYLDGYRYSGGYYDRAAAEEDLALIENRYPGAEYVKIV